jgi:protein-histidine N-methyltransferase
MTWGGVDQPGHLQITGQIKGAFKTMLEESGIKLEFTYGHWAGLAKEIKEEYDLVLTAETIYAEESVDDLIKLLQAAAGVATEQAEPASSGNKEDWATGIAQGERIVLVAAKVRLPSPLHPMSANYLSQVLYFGVGGGLAAFLQKVESGKGWWTNVKEWTRGVGRKVVRIRWT